MKKTQWARIVGLCLTVSLFGGIVGGVLTNEYLIAYVFDRFVKDQEEQMPIVKKVIEQHSYVEESKTIDALQKVRPSIVSLVESNLVAEKIISGEVDRQASFEYFGSDNFYLNTNLAGNSSESDIKGGTGFLMSSDGLVATCSSLVSGRENFVLITDNGDLFDATVVYNDQYDDFSLLKVEDENFAKYFSTIKFAEHDLENGQKVLAVGKDVFLKDRVLSAVVSHSGLENIANLSQKRIFPNEFVIIDANIDNNTNCGPVVNLGGELIGMAVNFDSSKPGRSYIIPALALKEKFYKYQELSE